MRIFSRVVWLAVLFLAGSGWSHARPGFTGENFSGVYRCTGNGAHKGKYAGRATLSLRRDQSSGNNASYDYKLDIPGMGVYLGEGVAHANDIALHFAAAKEGNKNQSTGIARIIKTRQGKLNFRHFYYEPHHKGGSTGVENCVFEKRIS